VIPVRPERLQRLRDALEGRLGVVHVAVEALHHRHNISAILRTCDAMGVHRVHLVEGHFKPSKGAARGAERWLDLHHHASPEAGIAAIRDAGCALWVADLADDAVPPEAVPVSVDRPVCLWFGAELVGVSEPARQAADGVVTIPMRGLAQSLNVSVAAALTLRAVAERARALGPDARLPRQEVEATWTSWMDREEQARQAVAARR
jgi:tRNA (guanosine-2'-O-)-methyltransferase